MNQETHYLNAQMFGEMIHDLEHVNPLAVGFGSCCCCSSSAAVMMTTTE